MAVRLARRRADVTPPRRVPLTVLLRPELVRTIAAAAARSGELETGGPLFGTVQRTWNGSSLVPVVSALGTVPPGSGVRGRDTSVSLGVDGDGDRASSALRWLRATTGLDLVHLGDWHVHPSGFCEPSAGDERTAEAMREESGAPVWLSAIAVCRRKWSEDVAASADAVRYTRERLESAEVRFFQSLGRRLVPTRARVEADAIPRLPPLPWHVTDPTRFATECRLLAAGGFKTAIEAAPKGQPGLALRVQREGGRTLVVLTGLDYPRKPPELRDGHGRRLVPRTPFSADRFLVDVVREVSP